MFDKEKTQGKVEAVRTIQNHSRGGTSNYWKTALPDYVMTDGVISVCDAAECHWLVDAILSHQTNPKVMAEVMQFWKLEERPHKPIPERDSLPVTRIEGVYRAFIDGVLKAETRQGRAILTCTDGDKGSGTVELARQDIEYTDFPRELMPFQIWISNKVLLLPEEY